MLNVVNPAERTAAETAVFGRTLRDDEYLDLIGDILGDAEITVEFNRIWAKVDGISKICAAGESRVAKTVVRLNEGLFDFSSCNVGSPGRGIGKLILYRMARTAQSHGFDRICADGEHCRNTEGELTSWGFFVYPLLGFDGEIPEKTPERPGDLQAAGRLSELLATQSGRDFWWEEGVQANGIEFDLTDGSGSWERLLNHIG